MLERGYGLNLSSTIKREKVHFVRGKIIWHINIEIDIFVNSYDKQLNFIGKGEQIKMVPNFDHKYQQICSFQ